MQFNKTSIPGVLIVEPDVFKDNRGFFFESYHKEKYQKNGIPTEFVQDNHSRSSRGTLRGLHIQLEQIQGKLVRVLEGEIFDVVVDSRRGSPFFGKWFGCNLSSNNFKQIYVPPGLLHGFCVLSETAEVEYKCSEFYNPASQISVVWNDPDLKIEWPVKNPVLSPKDAAGFKWKDAIAKFPDYKE